MRRQAFSRAGPVMRARARPALAAVPGWKTVRGSQCAELHALFAAHWWLCNADVLREQLDRLWTYRTRLRVLDCLLGWIKALRWQRLPEMERLGDFL